MTWETVPLGELYQHRGTTTPAPGTTYTLYSVPAYETGRPQSVVGIEIQSNKQHLAEGDVLLCRIVPHIRRAWIVSSHRDTTIGSTEWIVLRHPGLDKAFLRQYLLSDEFHSKFMSTLAGVGGSLSRARPAAAARIPIPLPPLPEQRRIAAILDEADALRSTAMRLTQASASLAESAFRVLEMTLSGRDVVPLSEIATVGSGITKGRKAPPAALVEVPYMTVANVQDKRLDLSNVKRIEASEAEIERYRLLTNDLLLTEGGDPDKLGRGVVWNSELPVSIHQNHVFRVRAIDASLDMTWLSWEIGSEYGKRYFLRAAKQTTGIATINSSQLRSFPVRVPSQAAIAAFRERLDQAEALKATSARRVDAIATLFTSLQHRAFRGEL